jgi:hypothetical protein
LNRWDADAGDVVTVNGYVAADRAGEIVQLMQTELAGLRAGDDALAATFVRARRTALARALADRPAQRTAGRYGGGARRGRRDPRPDRR